MVILTLIRAMAPKYQINYIYYYDLPMQQGMMCERYKVDGLEYDTKEHAAESAKRYNKENRRTGRYVVKLIRNAKQ